MGSRSSSRPPGLRRSERFFCVFLALLAAKVYGEVLSSEFIRFDDPRYVTQNPHVLAGLTRDGVAWAFTAFIKSNWHPLAWLSHMLDVTLFGVNPGGHHATSVAFHAANSVLLFAVLRAATGAVAAAAFVAAVFAVHPTHVESVAWIAERKDVLSTFFGLLATAAYVAYARRGGAGRYLAVAALFACSLAAKPMLVTLPCVFLLLDYWPLGRLRAGHPARRIFAEKLPWLALSAAVGGIAYAAQKTGGAVALGDPVALPDRIANAAVAYVRYVGMTVWPGELALVYPHPNLPGGTPWRPWQVIASAVTLLAVTAAVVRARRRPYLFVGWFWFVGTLVPVIGLVQAGSQAIADRYTYVPCIGLTIMLAWGVRDLAGRFGRTGTAVMHAAAACAVASLAVGAQIQVSYWRDSISIFERSLAVEPSSEALRNNLGNEFYDRGRIDEAIEQYRRVLEIHPDSTVVHGNLSNALRKRGEPYEAMRHRLIQRGIDPESAVGQLKLGEVRLAEGRLDQAEIHFRRSVELAPDSAFGYGRLAETLLARGEIDAALVPLRRAIAIAPDEPAFPRLLARALQRQRGDGEP